MTDYTPIDCGLHSEYELAIMRRQSLRLAWNDARGTPHIGVYRPLDLHTRDGEEFMVVADADGTESQIRLDYIMSYNPA
jgi:Rho-binding antiterminator